MKQMVLPLAVAMVVGGAWVSAQVASDADRRSAALLDYLNQTIGWYRQLDLQRQMATDPEEGLVVNENQQVANQVVSLAFEFARGQADAIERDAAARPGAGGQAASSRYLSLRRVLATVDQQIRSNQAELELLRQQLASAPAPQREALQARIDETQSEIQLAQTRRDSMQTMADFLGGSGAGATGIREKIETLARSVPAAAATPGAKPDASNVVPSTATAAQKKAVTGVWALTVDVFALSSRMRTLQDASQLTDTLSQTLKGLRAPLVGTLRDLSKRGDELAAAADASDPVVLVQQKAMFDALTAQFKRTADSALPLSKQAILLDVYKRNVANWGGSLHRRYQAELRDLLVGLGVLALVLGVIVAAAEVWRRAIFRYVHDARRRYQYLLLRKIVFWCVIGVVLVFSFANEIGSVATFAGLITAGVAVALQSVILSIVAYFFLIGRYGIRVGDQVQVNGITGEVVDVGLVRFHLLELSGSGEKTASGRVVAFANSVVFQPAAGFFKQIPGTSFRWHEVAVTMSPDSDYLHAEERLRAVVEQVFAEYRSEMEKQYRQIAKTLATTTAVLQPTSRLHPTPSGLEVVIRYSVDLMHGAEIDDRVTRELLVAMDTDPALKQAGSTKAPLRLKADIV